MNKVIICGNLGRDPELKRINAGTAVCSLNVATTSRYKDKGGQWQDKTEWHRVKVWGNTGENCHKHLGKGSKVLIEGRIETSTWEKGGQKQYTTEIIADRVEFIDKVARGGGNGHSSPQGGGGGYDPSFSDSDIPF
jgi:single-strand DNA-binding protein